MIRRAVVGAATGAVVAAGVLLFACSLAVSTSGLSSDVGPSQEGGEAASSDAPSDSQRGDAGADAARDPSLVGEYSFEDPVGGITARDTSGYEHHGFVQAGATFVPDGVRGRALAVSHTGFFVVDALGGKLFPRSGTLSVWFRFAKTSAVDDQASVFDSFDPDRSHLFVRHANGAPANEYQMAFVAKGATEYAAVVETTEPFDTWVHFVCTWDEARSEAAFYADGVLLRRAAYKAPFAPEAQLFRMGEGLVGGLDEVRVWSRALTEAEATKLD